MLAEYCRRVVGSCWQLSGCLVYLDYNGQCHYRRNHHLWTKPLEMPGVGVEVEVGEASLHYPKAHNLLKTRRRVVSRVQF